MALDTALTEAIKTAAREEGQGDAVASRLLAWLTQLSDSEISRDSKAQFYQAVLDALALPVETDDAD